MRCGFDGFDPAPPLPSMFDLHKIQSPNRFGSEWVLNRNDGSGFLFLDETVAWIVFCSYYTPSLLSPFSHSLTALGCVSVCTGAVSLIPAWLCTAPKPRAGKRMEPTHSRVDFSRGGPAAHSAHRRREGGGSSSSAVTPPRKLEWKLASSKYQPNQRHPHQPGTLGKHHPRPENGDSGVHVGLLPRPGFELQTHASPQVGEPCLQC